MRNKSIQSYSAPIIEHQLDIFSSNTHTTLTLTLCNSQLRGENVFSLCTFVLYCVFGTTVSSHETIKTLNPYYIIFQSLMGCWDARSHIYYLFNASIEFKEIGISFFAIFLEVQDFSGK